MRHEIAAAVFLAFAAAALSAHAAQRVSPAAGVGYRILSQDGGAERASVAVRLGARVPEPELRRLAEEIMQRRGKRAARTTVRFYLDGMALDGAPWAQAVAALDLKVSIGGLSLEEEQLFVAELKGDRRNLVGAWLTAPPALPGRIVIYRDKGRAFAEWRQRNGLKTTDELDESRAGRGIRFTVKGGDGGQFLLTPTGELELWQAERKIATGERIALDKLDSLARAPVPASLPQQKPAAGVVAVPGAPMRPLPMAPVEAAVAVPEPAPAQSNGNSVPPPSGAEPVAAAVTRADANPAAKKVTVVRRPSPPAARAPVKTAVRRDDGPIMRLSGQ